MWYRIHYHELDENKDKMDASFFYVEKRALEILIKQLEDAKKSNEP
jgi:hypothetical protein